DYARMLPGSNAVPGSSRNVALGRFRRGGIARIRDSVKQGRASFDQPCRYPRLLWISLSKNPIQKYVSLGFPRLSPVAQKISKKDYHIEKIGFQCCRTSLLSHKHDSSLASCEDRGLPGSAVHNFRLKPQDSAVSTTQFPKNGGFPPRIAVKLRQRINY